MSGEHGWEDVCDLLEMEARGIGAAAGVLLQRRGWGCCMTGRSCEDQCMLKPPAAWRFPGNACWYWRLGWVWGKDVWKRRSKWSIECGSLSSLSGPRECLLEFKAGMKLWERLAAASDWQQSWGGDWGDGLGGRSEHLRLAYQHPCHAWHEDSQGIPATVGGWVKKWVRKQKLGEGYLCDPLEMGARLEGRQQQVLSSRAPDETSRKNLEEWNKRERLRLVYLLHL